MWKYFRIKTELIFIFTSLPRYNNIVSNCVYIFDLWPCLYSSSTLYSNSYLHNVVSYGYADGLDFWESFIFYLASYYQQVKWYNIKSINQHHHQLNCYNSLPRLTALHHQSRAMIRSFGKINKNVPESKSSPLEDEKDPSTGKKFSKCFVEVKKMMEAKNKHLIEESIFYFLCSKMWHKYAVYKAIEDEISFLQIQKKYRKLYRLYFNVIIEYENWWNTSSSEDFRWTFYTWWEFILVHS